MPFRLERAVILVFALALMTSFVRAEIKTVEFQGFSDCLELSNGQTRVIVAPTAGGRITHYSTAGGPNFMWEPSAPKAETPSKARRPGRAGGYQCDIGPELDYPPQHPAIWSEPYTVEKLGALALRLASAKDDATGIQLSKELQLDAAGAGLTVKQTMKNISAKPVSWCLWDRTMSNAAYAFFELNPKSRFPARWSVRLGENRSYRYEVAAPSSPRVKLVGDLLVTVPGQKTEKVGADSLAGWVAGYRDGWVYVKRFNVDPAGNYADGGNSVELWVDAQTRTEIEPLSPKVTLAPDASHTLTEKWDLSRSDVKISGADDVPGLLPLIKGMAMPASR